MDKRSSSAAPLHRQILEALRTEIASRKPGEKLVAVVGEHPLLGDM